MLLQVLPDVRMGVHSYLDGVGGHEGSGWTSKPSASSMPSFSAISRRRSDCSQTDVQPSSSRALGSLEPGTQLKNTAA